MARIKLTSAGKSFLPEGTTTFKIMAVDDSCYDSEDRLGVWLLTAKGQTYMEWFNFRNKDGTDNLGARNAWSYFAKQAINDYNIDVIDTDDLLYHYVTADVIHYSYTVKNGKDIGKQRTCIRLKNFQAADGFATTETDERKTAIDDFLNG